jgi:Transposase DDE domain group 1
VGARPWGRTLGRARPERRASTRKRGPRCCTAAGPVTSSSAGRPRCRSSPAASGPTRRQPTLFEAEDGWRYSLWVTSLREDTAAGAASPPTSTPPTGCTHGSKTIRTGKDTGIGKFPSHQLSVNRAWLATALTATLLAWPRLLALDGDLTKAEPKALRYRILHAVGRLARSSRQCRLEIAATWPWTPAIVTAWDRISALPQAPDQQQTIPVTKKATWPRGIPGRPARQPGPVTPAPQNQDPQSGSRAADGQPPPLVNHQGQAILDDPAGVLFGTRLRTGRGWQYDACRGCSTHLPRRPA